MKRVFTSRTWRILFATILVVALVISPMVYRTWLWASDARGLTTIALLESRQLPLDPLNDESLLIRPEMAYWILTTFDWPYGRCSGIMRRMDWCEQPLVNMLGASLDMVSEPLRERGYGLLRHFIQRGELINERYRGLAPIHEAILYGNADYLRVLLEGGADPSVTVDKPDKAFHGFDALEFLTFLEARDRARYSAVRQVLEDWESV